MAEVKRKRGLSSSTRGVQAPSFNPSMDKYNGLNIATVSVVVAMTMAKDDTKQVAFIGHEIPSLVFHFVQADADEITPAEYVHSFRPMDYSDDSIEEATKVQIEDNNMEMINHFLTVMAGRTFNDEDYDKLGLGLDLEEGEVNGEKVLKAYTDFFNNVAKVINENQRLAKQRFWLKLIRYAKSHSLRGGAPAIGNFLQKGWIEIAKAGVEATLTIDVAKGESVVVREVVVNSGIAGAQPGMPAGVPSGVQAGAAPAVPDWADEE